MTNREWSARTSLELARRTVVPALTKRGGDLPLNADERQELILLMMLGELQTLTRAVQRLARITADGHAVADEPDEVETGAVA